MEQAKWSLQRLPGPMLPCSASIRIGTVTLGKEARREGRVREILMHGSKAGRGHGGESPLEPGIDSKERKRKCLARPGTSTAPLLDCTIAIGKRRTPCDGYSHPTEISA